MPSEHNPQEEDHHRIQRGMRKMMKTAENVLKAAFMQSGRSSTCKRLLLYLLMQNFSATRDQTKLSGLSFWCRAPTRSLTSPIIWRHISKVDYKLKNGVAPFIPIQPDSLFQRAGVGVRLDAVQPCRQTVYPLFSCWQPFRPLNCQSLYSCQCGVWTPTRQRKISAMGKIWFHGFWHSEVFKAAGAAWWLHKHRRLCVWLVIIWL